MSNTTRASSLPSTLANVQQQLTWILLPCYIVFAIIGNIGCIIVFLQNSHRSSSCALYLLAAAITNIFIVTFGVATTIWNALQTTILASSLLYCKLRQYVNHTSIMIARMYIVLAAIDTYTMSSSVPTFRSFSQPSVAYKCIVAVLVGCPLIAIHIPIVNIIVNGRCAMPGVYMLIFAIYQMLIAGTIPPLAMIGFNWLAYRNMKTLAVASVDASTIGRRKRQQQRQFLRMVIVQVAVYVISAELTPLVSLYKYITSDIHVRNKDRQAIESFITFMAMTCLLYLNGWLPFFIYYATSKNFRIEFIRCIKKISRIHPA